MSKCIFVGAATKENYVEDYLRPVRLALRGKACLVCFRERSDEIVGLNIAYRATRNDTQMPEVYKAVLVSPSFSFHISNDSKLF